MNFVFIKTSQIFINYTSKKLNYWINPGFTFLAGGTYPFKSNERLKTDTELNAIAKPANSGLNIIPKNGYNTPAATGISITLYAKAQNKFCFIL